MNTRLENEWVWVTLCAVTVICRQVCHQLWLANLLQTTLFQPALLGWYHLLLLLFIYCRMFVFSFFQLLQSTTIYLRKLPLLHNLMPFIYLFNRLQLMRHYEGKVFVKCAEPEKLDVFSYYDCILWQVSFYKICTFFQRKKRRKRRRVVSGFDLSQFPDSFSVTMKQSRLFAVIAAITANFWNKICAHKTRDTFTLCACAALNKPFHYHNVSGCQRLALSFVNIFICVKKSKNEVK